MKRQVKVRQGGEQPAGFNYEPDWLSGDEEGELIRRMTELPFKPFEFQGYTGKRRIVSFGWQYDFVNMKIRKADDIPPPP